MFNNAHPDGLSRSVSHNDQSEQSLSYLRDQSSCSSLTSGIGQSDQSICNDRVPARDETGELSNLSNSTAQLTTPTDSVPCDLRQHSETVLPDNKAKITTIPQYLRSPSAASESQKHHMGNNDVNETLPSGLPLARPNGSTSTYAETSNHLRADIKQFVDIIFTDSQSISLERKAEFGQLMRTPEARLLFAIFVDDYRVNSKRVSELTFYSLAQYFSIVLLECLLAEDFRPAKIIMNMMFTYYYEQTLDRIPERERSIVLSQDPMANKTVISYDDQDEENSRGGGGGPNQNGGGGGEPTGSQHRSEPKTAKTYLYTLLKDQEIFKSIRFWTSAFYESVIIERNNHPVFVDKSRGKLSIEKRDEELDCSKNITFGLLGSFIHNMCLLDLSHEFCQEFLNKHSTIAGLSECQLEMLRSNLEAMFRETSADETPLSNASAGERLSKFLQKLSTRLNQSNSSLVMQQTQQPQQHK